MEMDISDDSQKSTTRGKLNNEHQRTSCEREGEQTPVTKRELESLEKARATPVLETHLRPGKQVEAVIHQEVQRRLEGRIDLVRGKLDSAKGLMEKDFSNGKRKGRAKNDFDRSR